MENVRNKVMIVRLSVKCWGASKMEKEITNEVAMSYGADPSMGRYTKKLVQKKALEQIQQYSNKIRKFFRANTLPWDDNGGGLLLNKNWSHFTDEMSKLKIGYDNAVKDFCNNYDQWRNNASNLLNGLYKEDDYPNTDQIESKFGVKIEYSPLPAGEDFRVDLKNEEVLKIRQEIDENVKGTIEEAMTELWTRLQKTVEHVIQVLNKPEDTDWGKTIKDSLIDNVREITEMLPKLNLTNDVNLIKINREIEDKLIKHPQSLRDSSMIRESTKKQGDDIMKQMSAFMGHNMET